MELTNGVRGKLSQKKVGQSLFYPLIMHGEVNRFIVSFFRNSEEERKLKTSRLKRKILTSAIKRKVLVVEINGFSTGRVEYS